MTAIPPVETRNVIAVAARRYPLNKTCAHPTCLRTDVTAHHIYPKGNLNGKAWFLVIDGDEKNPVPHVVGLCGHGTEGHHGDCEEHRAWIRFEDGQYVWYQRRRTEAGDTLPFEYRDGTTWDRVGPLNPQPGSQDGKTKRKPPKSTTGPVKVASFKAPNDDPEAAQRLKEKAQQLTDKFNAHGHEIGKTVAVERALDYTLLNAGEEDF